MMKKILLAGAIFFGLGAQAFAACAVTNLQVKDNAAVTANVPYADDGSGASNCSPQIQIKQGGHVANVTAAGAVQVDNSGVTQPVSGTVTAVPSNTANTTPWLFTPSDGTNAMAFKAASTAAVAADKSGVVQESPNSQLSVAVGTTSDVANANTVVGQLKQLTLNSVLPIPLGSASGGWTPKLLNALSTTVTSIKSSAAGQLGYIACGNTNASQGYLQVFDVATAGGVTLGTTTPKLSLPIPASNSTGFTLPLVGIQFANGIQVAATTTATGSTALGTALDCNAAFN